MTVSTTHVSHSYTGNGSKKDYDFNFACYDETHIKVYLDSVLKTLNIHYTITLSNKKVWFIDAPASGVAITLNRSVPLTQTTDYVSHDTFPAETHERALDYLTMIAQQAIAELERVFKVPVSSGLGNVEVPVGASKLIGWNGSGTAISLYSTVVDTGVITSKGQMIRGGDAGAAEAFTIGSAGDHLTPIGDKPAWKPGLTVSLMNKSGGSLAAGDVCIIDADNDSAAEATTTRSDTNPIIISAGTISVDVTGPFTRGGVVTVNVQGNVIRGNYLRTSTTSKRAEDAGSAVVTGVFALALTGYAGGGAGTVQAILLGLTQQSADTVIGYGPFSKNLVVKTPLSAAGDYQVDIDADFVVIEGYKKGPIDLTADITVAGANGLDTGSEASNTWYYVWLIYNPTTDVVASLLSTSATSPTMPSGYTKKRHISYVRNYSSDFHGFQHVDDVYQYIYYSPDAGMVKIVDSGGSTTTTAIDLSTLVPPKVKGCFGRAFTNALGTLFLHPINFSNALALDNTVVVCEIYNAAATQMNSWEIPMMVEDSTIYYQLSASTADIFLCGFTTRLL